MIDRQTAGLGGLLGLGLALSPFVGSSTSKVILNQLNPEAPEPKIVRLLKNCELVDPDHNIETATLNCQRYYDIDGRQVVVGPKYTYTSPEPRNDNTVPLSHYYSVL